MGVRLLQVGDEDGWLRCRVLSFLGTAYFDDVRRGLPTGLDLRLVHESGSTISGVIDVEIDGDAATIDTIAVHPDFQRRGIADELLAEVRSRLDGVVTLDAWTRDDAAANAWYQSAGFEENFRYLHVYLSEGDSTDDFATPDGLSAPIGAFMHAPIDLEEQMRARFARIHVCRQYVLAL